MADPSIVTCLSLFSGIGGLDLGVDIALAGRLRVLGYVEREAYAAAILLARMEDKALEPAPVWCGDLVDVDLSPFAGVDLVTAGTPCQPYSVAGKRAGEKDERYLWPLIFRSLETMRPSMVFLENVPGILGFFRPIGEELCRMGYELEACLVRASDVGAPHRRERVFILAHRNGDGREVLRSGGILDGEREAQRDDADGLGAAMAVAERSRRTPPGGPALDSGSEPGAGCCEVVNPERTRLEERLFAHDGSGTVRHERTPTFPPGPSDVEGWQCWLRSGGPAPATTRAESILRHGTDGLSSRMDELRCLGNAVVPQQAALAFSVLWKRMKAHGQA